MASLPSLQAPVLDASGRFTQPWVGFLTGLTRQPGAIQPLAMNGSPYSFTAPEPGFLALTGGNGIGIGLIRGRKTIALDPAGGMVPVAQGDTVRVSYASAPTLFFVPRGP